MSAPENPAPVESVGVVVLTLGEDEQFRSVLRELMAQGVPAAAICVVHNPVSPVDRSIVPPHPDIFVARLSHNLGYSGGMNAGLEHHLQHSHKRWLWVITQDVHLRPGAVSALVQTGEAHPEYGALGPVLVLRGTDTVFSLGGRLDFRGRASHVAWGSSETSLGASRSQINDCDWLDGASIMFNADALRQCGTFDSRFFAYCEDSEIGWRLRTAGWKVGVVNGACVEQATGYVSRPGVFAFLRTRNSLAVRHAVGGTPAVRQGACDTAIETARVLKRLATGRYPVDDRRRRVASVVGNVMGLIAYAVGRWGSPPTWLPGAGDIRPRQLAHKDVRSGTSAA